jgi:hypothetical protein
MTLRVRACGALPPNPAPAKLTAFAKPPHPSPARGEENYFHSTPFGNSYRSRLSGFIVIE